MAGRCSVFSGRTLVRRVPRVDAESIGVKRRRDILFSVRCHPSLLVTGIDSAVPVRPRKALTVPREHPRPAARVYPSIFFIRHSHRGPIVLYYRYSQQSRLQTRFRSIPRGESATRSNCYYPGVNSSSPGADSSKYRGFSNVYSNRGIYGTRGRRWSRREEIRLQGFRELSLGSRSVN